MKMITFVTSLVVHMCANFKNHYRINNEVQNIPEQYLSKVTPLFESLVELKERDFRKTDNREIFNKVDDYLALIKCDIHICLASPMARLESLIEFINVIKNDAESLRKFPRIVTRCYSTESRICQEICEVYSDDDFQTVNIKKMSKMKPCVKNKLYKDSS